MGDAAARAERPARRMAVAYMFAVMNMLFEVEGVVDVMMVLWIATVVLLVDLM